MTTNERKAAPMNAATIDRQAAAQFFDHIGAVSRGNHRKTRHRNL
jgi:hypothetical protein